MCIDLDLDFCLQILMGFNSYLVASDDFLELAFDSLFRYIGHGVGCGLAEVVN